MARYLPPKFTLCRVMRGADTIEGEIVPFSGDLTHYKNYIEKVKKRSTHTVDMIEISEFGITKTTLCSCDAG